MKWNKEREQHRVESRSPCGERGLKSRRRGKPKRREMSLPVRGAWIEINSPSIRHVPAHTSLPVRGAWIEIRRTSRKRCGKPTSLPVRGAWIEMSNWRTAASASACRSPCGERGLKYPRRTRPQSCRRRSPCGERGLKLRGELRNRTRSCRSPCGERGLKCQVVEADARHCWSLPVRGAWIEIAIPPLSPIPRAVAPRAGSVD